MKLAGEFIEKKEKAVDESTRKHLTSYLGEDLHEQVDSDGFCSCGNYHRFRDSMGECPNNRTFQTPEDFFAVFNKLVADGEWIGYDGFRRFAIRQFEEENGSKYRYVEDEFDSWYHATTPNGTYRLCKLCASYLQQKGEK